MTDTKLCCLLANLTSRKKDLMVEFSAADNTEFFSAVDTAMAAAKALLATLDTALYTAESKVRFCNDPTPEPMEMSLSDVSANTSGLGSENTSEVLDLTAESDKKEPVGVEDSAVDKDLSAGESGDEVVSTLDDNLARE